MRKLRPFRSLFVAGAILLSPVLLFDVVFAFRDGVGFDRLTLFTVPVSILWIVLAQTAFRRALLGQLVLLAFYVLTAIDLFLVVRYDSRLGSSALSMILENLNLAPDFARAQALPLAAGVALLAGFCAAMLATTRRLQIPSRAPARAAALGLVVLYGALFVLRARATGDAREAVAEIVSHDRSSPFGIFPQSYVALRVYEDARDHQRRSAAFTFGTTRPAAPAGPELYVLVVGESSRRDHWGLYGAARDTTPLLARERNLIVLRDVVTQAALTQISVPLMITRGSIDAPQAHADEKSIVSAFREAGFETFWLSTQQRDQFTGAINRYAGEADHTRFFERRHDEILVDALKQAVLERPANKLFFVLHTQGSHYVFKDRYPSGFARFDGAASTPREELLAQYDDSIAYTDAVLAQLISFLKTRPGLAALMYVADHGENLYDDDRQLFGHFLNNEYDMPIPALLWMSDGYTAAYPARRATALQNAGRALNTRIVFPTLLDLAGLDVHDPAQQTLSVLSPHLAPPVRMFEKRGRTADYDAWRGLRAQR